MVSTRAIIEYKAIAVFPISLTLSKSLFPTFLAIRMVTPMEKPVIVIIIIFIIGPHTATAARPAVPTYLPTKNISTALYSA